MAETQLITNKALLAVAHGPGVDVANDAHLGFLHKGAMFIKYHRQASLLSSSAKRFLFYQHNHLFFVKPNTARPQPGEEHRVDAQYQTALTSINEVIVGKSASTFKSRQAANVPAERAWSLIVTRKSGEVENVDFEAQSQQERDAWTSALKLLVVKAKAAKADHETAIKLVTVRTTVKENGEVVVETVPFTAVADASAVSPVSENTATTIVAPLNIATTAEPTGQSKADDDTPTAEDFKAAHTIDVAPTESIANNTVSNDTEDKTVVSGAVNETVRLDTPTPSVMTLTTVNSAGSQSIEALENENAALKARVAELEAKLASANLS